MASMYCFAFIALFSLIYFNDVKADCGGLIQKTSGIITSPFYPSKYPPNQNCTWEIKLPSNHRVGLKFKNIHLKEDNNRAYLKIRSKLENGRFQEHGTLRSPPSDTILSKNNVLLIEFRSEGSDEYEGFELEFFSVFSSCGGLIQENAGAITSPNYSDNYPPNMNCTWTLQAPPNHIIKLNFETFVLENACSLDNVTVKSVMGDGRFREHGIFCGPRIPPVITSESNVLQIKFKTDPTVQYKGFLALFSFVYSKCGGLIEDSEGSITSPHYSNSYPANMNCTWTIRALQNQTIKLKFEKFQLEPHNKCSSDYVTVKSQMPDGTIRVHGRFCGLTEIPSVIYSESNILLIQFVSDGSVEYGGFHSTFERVGGLVDGSKGNISTPFYPNPYPSNTVFEWTIPVPPQHKLKLRFLDFNVEEGGSDCLNDFLLVSYKLGGLMHQEKYCGDKKPSPITLKHRNIALKFVSDHSIEKRGFLAEYSIDKWTDYEVAERSAPIRYIPDESLTVKEYEDE